eukprot:360210-Chlamydomonas_euryale.AAC.11
MARQSQRAKRTVHQSQRANQNGPSESKSRAKNDPSASALLQLWQRRQQLLRVAAAGGADPHAARRPGGEARNGRLQAHMRNNSPASSGVGGLLRGAKACTLPAGRAALGVAPRRRRGTGATPVPDSREGDSGTLPARSMRRWKRAPDGERDAGARPPRCAPPCAADPPDAAALRGDMRPCGVAELSCMVWRVGAGAVRLGEPAAHAYAEAPDWTGIRPRPPPLLLANSPGAPQSDAERTLRANVDADPAGGAAPRAGGGGCTASGASVSRSSAHTHGSVGAAPCVCAAGAQRAAGAPPMMCRSSISLLKRRPGAAVGSGAVAAS